MSKVEKICGSQPNDFIKLDISNDPSFIFEADSSYISRQLFDEEGNIVSVNSYIECEHYVSGGWDSNLNNFNETNYQSYVVSFSLLTFLIILVFKNFKLIKVI